MAYLSLRNAALTTSSINVSSLNMNTAQFSTLTSAYSVLNTTGLNLSTTNTAITVTGATYNTSTLLAVLSFASTAAYPPVGAWVTVAGVTPSGYNGSFLVTASSATSITVQNYTGTTLTYSSGGTITINSAGSAGLTFGDTTTMVTHKAPVVTYITTNSAVAGTPLSVSGYYTTPIGAKYLRVRMVGGGAGGSGPTTTGGNGGNTTFGSSMIAYGGLAAINNGTGYSNPFLTAATGGLGGGWFPITGSSTTSTTATITITTSNTVTNLFATAPVAGTSFTLFGFVPSQWNGTYTVTSSSTSSITFAASSYSAVTTYGLLCFPTNPSSTIFTSPGGCGFGTATNNANPGQGGASAFGGSLPGPLTNGYTAAQTATLNMGAYGGGGGGSNTTSGYLSGVGGGAGQYVEGFVSIPSAGYAFPFTIGSGGSGSTANVASWASTGISGMSGIIIVEAYF